MDIMNIKEMAAVVREISKCILRSTSSKMHFEISRTTAAISLIFIISITPWAFQEGVIACIGGQVSPLMDFIFNLLGGSYHLWSPIIYSYFHPKFRKAAKEYIEEEILCRRQSSESCCSNHGENGQHSLMNHQHGIGSLLGNIRPVMISTAAIANEKLVDTKPVKKHLEANEIVPSRIAGDIMTHQHSLSPTSKAYENTPVHGQRPKVREETRDKQGLHTTGYSVMSQRKLAKDPFRSNRSLAPKSNLCFLMPSAMTSNIVSPGTRRPLSAMDSKTRNVSIEEIREQHWGEILEKSLSRVSLNVPNSSSSAK
jgi:hypothetical protein